MRKIIFWKKYSNRPNHLKNKFGYFGTRLTLSFAPYQNRKAAESLGGLFVDSVVFFTQASVSVFDSVADSSVKYVSGI